LDKRIERAIQLHEDKRYGSALDIISALSFIPEKLLDLAKNEKQFNFIISDSMSKLSVNDAFEYTFLAETHKRIN
jgi:hypothetical protein